MILIAANGVHEKAEFRLKQLIQLQFFGPDLATSTGIHRVLAGIGRAGTRGATGLAHAATDRGASVGRLAARVAH